MADETPPRRSTLVWVLPALVLAPVLYVASLGPALWVLFRLMDCGVPWIENSAEYLMLPWMPIGLLASQFEPFGHVLEWYIQFFEPGMAITSPPSTPVPAVAPSGS